MDGIYTGITWISVKVYEVYILLVIAVVMYVAQLLFCILSGFFLTLHPDEEF